MGILPLVTENIAHPVPEVATYESGAPAFLAALRAPLTTHRGCLVAGTAASHVLVVFRARDIDWDGQVLSHEGRQYRIGDVLDVGGGHMSLDRLKGLYLPGGWSATEQDAFVVAPSGPRVQAEKARLPSN